MKPVPDIQGLGMAFGDTEHLPPIEEIPEEFKNPNHDSKWNKVFNRWFFSGLPKDTEFVPKAGVDPKKAIRALAAIMKSWGPKHEHKEAGVAYLMSEWFDDVKIPKEK